MSFSRTRTQILYRYLPGAIFEHDEYGICQVTNVALTAPRNQELNMEALRNAMGGLLALWRGNGDDAFPDPDTAWDEYRIGIPDRVEFEPFPELVECNNCNHVISLRELSRQFTQDRSCVQCRTGRYRQLPYLMIHGCGAPPQSMRMPPCSQHGTTNIQFVDTGRFVTAFWRCGVCGTQLRRLTQVPCGCVWGRRMNNPNMRYVRTNDTSVLYSQTVSFVNLDERLLTRLCEDPRPTGLLLARLWGLINTQLPDVIEERRVGMRPSAAETQVRDLAEQLARQNPDSPIVQQLLAQVNQMSQRPGDDAIDQVAALVTGVDAIPSRGLFEHLAIMDTLETMTTDDARENTRQRGDTSGVFDIEAAVEVATTTLGMRALTCVTNFPLALASVGFTRAGNNPTEAQIRPIRSLGRGQNEDGRPAILVITSTTEGILVQLEPQRVAQWLIVNGFVSGSPPTSEIESWLWMRRNLPGLGVGDQLLRPADTFSRAEQSVLTLLHTISHLLLRQIEWSGFDPESVGEYLLPETLGVVIHANNYRAFTIGGMVTMFEQRLNGWLQDTLNAAYTCVYNPICEDDGASCSGCLHRQHNCIAFNSFLSRSVLIGGMVLDQGLIVTGFWRMDEAIP